MMKKFVSNLIVITMVLFASVSVIPVASAAAEGCGGQTFIFPKWYDDLCNEKGDGIKSPAEMGNGNAKTADDTAAGLSQWLGIIAMNIVKMIMTVVGYVALGFIIWGGFRYMISGDSSSGTVAARKTIQNAVIGLVLSIMSVALINFVTGAIA